MKRKPQRIEFPRDLVILSIVRDRFPDYAGIYDYEGKCMCMIPDGLDVEFEEVEIGGESVEIGQCKNCKKVYVK